MNGLTNILCGPYPYPTVHEPVGRSCSMIKRLVIGIALSVLLGFGIRFLLSQYLGVSFKVADLTSGGLIFLGFMGTLGWLTLVDIPDASGNFVADNGAVQNWSIYGSNCWGCDVNDDGSVIC